MAKISNISAYPGIQNLDAADYLVITDAENSLMTKTATISQIQELFGIDTLVAKVTVSNQALLGVGTALTIIPAPGATKIIDVISIQAYFDAGSIQYDFGTNGLNFKIDSVSFGAIQQSKINSATDIVTKPGNSGGLTVGINQPLVLVADDGNATVGTGDLYVNIFYRVLTTGTSF